MAGKDMYIPCPINNIPGGLDSRRAFPVPKFPTNNLSFRKRSATNYTRLSGPVFSGTNVCVPNFSGNSSSGWKFPPTNLGGEQHPPPPPPLPVGLDSPRAFSGPELSPTNACVLNFSGNSQPFQELPATNFDVPDYSVNNISGLGFSGTPDYSANNLSFAKRSATNYTRLSGPVFSGTNVCVPNFSGNSSSGWKFPPTNLGGEQHPPPPPPLPVGLDSPRAFSGLELSPTNACVLNFSGNSQPFQELPATNFDVPDYSVSNFSGLGFSGTPDYSANNFSGPGFSAINFCAPNFSANSFSRSEFPATNFAGVWNGGISGHGSNLPQSSDNTLEALIHVSPSLRISPKEAIGVQIENNRSESVEVFQIDEVMPMNSSAQKPIGENKGKRTGRTKIEIPLEDLLKYDTVKEAALNHNVSESTVDRRIKEYTKGSWSIAKRKEFARKPVSKKGRMQDKNRVLVKVAYEGTKRSFEMPWASKLGELHSLVESSLKLEAGSTYDIQYFDGAEDISIACDANLHCCFANAPRSPRSNSILLNLTDS